MKERQLFGQDLTAIFGQRVDSFSMGMQLKTMITEWNNAENNQTSPGFRRPEKPKNETGDQTRDPGGSISIAAWICCAIQCIKGQSSSMSSFVTEVFCACSGLHRVTRTLWGKQESQSATCDGMRQERKSISNHLLFNVHAHGWFATNDHTPKSPPNWLGNSFGY